MPERPLSKEQARAYVERWRLVNEREAQEIRATPMEVKLRQFAVLMNTTKALGWTEQLSEDDEEVRARWNRLREVLLG
jgi:hypothetical protein